jgi:acyl-CoA thioesterase FadM
VSAGPTAAQAPYRFSARQRVGFDETDAQAVVYYGRYFPSACCTRSRPGSSS